MGIPRFACSIQHHARGPVSWCGVVWCVGQHGGGLTSARRKLCSSSTLRSSSTSLMSRRICSARKGEAVTHTERGLPSFRFSCGGARQGGGCAEAWDLERWGSGAGVEASTDQGPTYNMSNILHVTVATVESRWHAPR
jgi:hypothetical protein